MKRTVLGVFLAAGILLGAQPADAVELCLGLSNFGNVFRLEAVNFGAAIFSIVGHDRLFEERAVDGTLYVGSTFAEIGFTVYGSGNTAHFRGTLSLFTGAGPYNLTFNGSTGVTTGTMVAISCAGVPAVAGAAEPTQRSLDDFASALTK